MSTYTILPISKFIALSPEFHVDSVITSSIQQNRVQKPSVPLVDQCTIDLAFASTANYGRIAWFDPLAYQLAHGAGFQGKHQPLLSAA